jgi:hypothetical protein
MFFSISLIPSLKYTLILFLKCLLVLYLTLFIFSQFIWREPCNHCSSSRFPSFNGFENSHETMTDAASARNDLDSFRLKFSTLSNTEH